MVVKRFLVILVLIVSSFAFAKHSSIEKFEKNLSLLKSVGDYINNDPVFMPLLDKVNKSNPWWTYDKILAGLKSNGEIDKNKNLKYIYDHKNEFLIYYSRGGLHVIATEHPLEKEIDNLVVRNYLKDLLIVKIKKEIDGHCTDSLEEYCEGYMDCSQLDRYFYKNIESLKKYNTEYQFLISEYKKYARNKYNSLRPMILERVKKQQPFPVIKITPEKINAYFGQCLKRIN